MSRNIPITELQASRIEATFHRRRALVLEQQNLERDELIITQQLEAEHRIRPGSYAVDHIARVIVVKD